MGKDISGLKYVIYEEWVSDPPAGTERVFYTARGESYSDLLEPIEWICEDMCFAAPDETETITEECASCKAAKESISCFGWSDSCAGCSCYLVCEGREIADEAASFLLGEFDLEDIFCWYGDEEDEEDDEDIDWGDLTVDYADADYVKYKKSKLIIERAKADPGDYDAVIALLDLIEYLLS